MKWVWTFAAGLCLGGVLAGPAAAQSTIINSPTTDTMAPGTAYVELDQIRQMPGSADEPHVQTVTPRVVFGVSPRLEAGVNVSSTMAAGPASSLIEPNVKYKLVAEDHAGIAAAAGVVWYVPLGDRGHSRPFGLIYGAFSKQVRGGPRFTIGPYAVVAGREGFVGPRGGVLAGYEQPLSTTISFVADWFSGRNVFGYLTPGVSIRLRRNALLSIGYSFGNDSFQDPPTHDRALVAYVGMAFR